MADKASAQPTPQGGGGGTTPLPSGYHTVPISPGQEGSPLRVCVVVRKDADPVAGHLVVLRDTLDARVLLGCVADASGRVHHWVEVWVQSPEGVAETPQAYREFLTGAVLDERWRRQCAAYDELDPPGLIHTGFESKNPPPVAIDLDAMAPALLPADGGGEAPKGGRRVPVNPSAGLLMVRPHHPLTYEQFADMLAGIPTEGPAHGTTSLGLASHISASAGVQGNLRQDGRFFSSRKGRAGVMIETLHLKLRLIAGAIEAVRTLVAHTQRPLLNLSAESFAVSAARPAPGLPHLWTSRVHLVDPGDAVALPVPGTATQYFVRGRSGASV